MLPELTSPRSRPPSLQAAAGTRGRSGFPAATSRPGRAVSFTLYLYEQQPKRAGYCTKPPRGALCPTAGRSLPSPPRLPGSTLPSRGHQAVPVRPRPERAHRPPPPLPAVPRRYLGLRGTAGRGPRLFRAPRSHRQGCRAAFCRVGRGGPLLPPGPSLHRLPARSFPGASARRPPPITGRVPRAPLGRSASATPPLAPGARYRRRQPSSAPPGRPGGARTPPPAVDVTLQPPQPREAESS